MAVRIKEEGTSYTTLYPLDRILPLLKGLRELSGGRGYVGPCPAHRDSHPSFTIWEDQTDHHVGIHCFAGCPRRAIVESIGLTETDLYVENKKRFPLLLGLASIYDLAVDKLISPHLLDQLGITDGHRFHTQKGDVQAVHIPYFHLDGKPCARFRIRTALTAKDGSAWNTGDAEILPYGLHKLTMAREQKFLVIVEGESDCWTLWFHQLPALGMPGAQHANKMKREYLEGIERVFLLQEPDDSGSKFVRDMQSRLLRIGYKGKVHTLDLTAETSAKDPNDLHKRNPAAFKAAFLAELEKAKKSTTLRLDHISSFEDLMKREFAPIKWIVPDLIPEGMTLLGGKQKLGKSWMELQLGLAVAQGGVFLGNIKVEQGDVLYLALEDNERRLQDRMHQILPEGERVPPGFHYALKWPRMGPEGLAMIEEWLDEHPNTRLIMIDTWGRVKPTSKAQNGYDADVDAASGLQTLAGERRIAILVTCHLRKSAAEDALDELNATTGLSATADNILILKRERGQADASLFGTGREIDADMALSFNDGFWKNLGSGPEYRLSTERKAVIDILHDSSSALGAKEIASLLSSSSSSSDKYITEGAIRKRLFDMKRAGEIKEITNGKYIALLGNVGNVGNSSNTGHVSNTGRERGSTTERKDGYCVTALPDSQNAVTHLNPPVESVYGYSVTSVTTVTKSEKMMDDDDTVEHSCLKRTEAPCDICGSYFLQKRSDGRWLCTCYQEKKEKKE